MDVDRARLFVAVWPPDDVLDALAALPRVEEPGVRYTTRAQWHVTLRFLGSCAVGDALAAFERVDSAPCVADLGPAVSRLGRDVVVVPVRGLDGLAAAVVAAMAEVGEPPDPRPFAGHLTVARLRHRGACRVAGSPITASFPVEEIALVRSHTGEGGSRYETVASRRLA